MPSQISAYMTPIDGATAKVVSSGTHYLAKKKALTANSHLPIPTKPVHAKTPKYTHSDKSKYNRKDWPYWVDYDGDYQDARAETLIRDSIDTVKYKRNKGCNVTWGKWLDPYTLQTFTKASDIDIDHFVPLTHAHYSGVANWSKKQKR